MNWAIELVQTIATFRYTSRGSPITVAVEPVKYLWDERWGTPSFNKSEPYLVTCPAPASVLPRAVSLTTEPCAPVINVLTVQHEVRAPIAAAADKEGCQLFQSKYLNGVK